MTSMLVPGRAEELQRTRPSVHAEGSKSCHFRKATSARRRWGRGCLEIVAHGGIEPIPGTKAGLAGEVAW